jgi:hypothetical protein
MAFRSQITQIYGVNDRTDSPADLNAQNTVQGKIMQGQHAPELTKIFTKLYQNYTQYEKEGDILTILSDSSYQEQVPHLLTHAYPDLSTDESAKTIMGKTES